MKTINKPNSTTYATINHFTNQNIHMVAIKQGTGHDESILAIGRYHTKAGAIKFINKQFAI